MKKLLICLTVLFSAFLFTNKVNAAYTDLKPMDNENPGSGLASFTLEDIYTVRDNLGLDSNIYDSFLLTTGGTNAYGSYKYIATLYFFNNDADITYNVGSKNASIYIQNSNYSSYYLTNMNIKDNTNLNIVEYFSSASYNTGVSSNMNFKSTKYDLDTFYYSNVPINYNGVVYEANAVNKTYNVTLHLNGGIAYDNNFITDDKGSYIVGNKYEDYTINVSGNNLISYLSNVYITKEPMQFVGWYYDEKLTQKVESTDTINSDKDFYAKYQYKNVEDFLNNNTFNSHTFDENYQYAIISLNDQTNRDIYLGLELMSYSFEVYKYNKINLEYHQGASLCLTPIFSKDNKYYYHLDSPLNEDYEVLILPKEKLQGKYNFLLSSNAYVTYTNDLKNVVIKDESGNDITTDLENSYDYSQDALLNSENDLLEIFKDLINNKDNNVFSYFNQVWNYLKQNRLYIYFMTLIIGALIILIIKTASR